MTANLVVVLLVLLVFMPSHSRADCGIVTREQLLDHLPKISENAYFSGLLLGGSIVLYLLSAFHYLYRTQSYGIPTLTGLLFFAIAGGFFVLDTSIGSECGIPFGSSGLIPNLSLFAITMLISAVHYRLASRRGPNRL